MDAVTYEENRIIIKKDVLQILSLILYLDLSVSDDVLLKLSELPSFLFKDKYGIDKYSYLKSKIDFQKLSCHLVENVKDGRVKTSVLEDHIEFFTKNRDDSITICALNICKQEKENTPLRTVAWQYLYTLYGAEYIETEIIPFADGDFLVEINNRCEDINENQMKFFMEKQYKKLPSTSLQAHLITLGSEHALENYVDYVVANKKVPEGKTINTSGPTNALKSVCDVRFLTRLKELLITIFDKDFEDSDWCGLRSSLFTSFVNCGKKDPEETIQTVISCRPEAEVDENNFRYCNQIVLDIQSTQISQQDIPLALTEVQALLEKLNLFIVS